MSSDAKNAAKTDLVFYGVATYISALWVFFGLCVLVAFIKLVFPEARQVHTPQLSRTAQPPTAGMVRARERVSQTRPTVDSDGTLQNLTNRYASLAAKRSALRAGDDVAISAFNVEAAEYMRAVASFRTMRAAQLRLLAPIVSSSSSSSIQVPVSSFTSYNSLATDDHYVAPYARANGTTVQGHYRTNRDETRMNNYSTKGNINPHTGRSGTVRP